MRVSSLPLITLIWYDPSCPIFKDTMNFILEHKLEFYSHKMNVPFPTEIYIEEIKQQCMFDFYYALFIEGLV